MRHAFIGGNWKMHGDTTSIQTLLSDILSKLPDHTSVDIAIFPSFVYVPLLAQHLTDTPIAVGAQNLSEHDAGAYTGETSGTMLRDVGCQYVLVGHSERRQLYNESSQLVAEKFTAAQKHALTPVLCVGETQAERDAGQTQAVVIAQLQAVIDMAGMPALANAILAYEPVWAIGTGLTATPEEAQAVHAAIRDYLAHLDSSIANSVRIIYGGSVKPNNALALFKMPDIDGGLVGGASLKADQFIDICLAQSSVS